jgi:hypothetical protein
VRITFEESIARPIMYDLFLHCIEDSVQPSPDREEPAYALSEVQFLGIVLFMVIVDMQRRTVCR